MSAYYDLLETVEAALNGASGLAGYEVKLRPAPIYLRDQDAASLPMILVCPRRDVFEKVDGLTFSPDGQADGTGGAQIAYPALVIFVFENTQDKAALQRELDAREVIRLACFKVLSGTYDVEYDPSPRGGSTVKGLTEPLDASAQQFTYLVAEPRSA